MSGPPVSTWHPEVFFTCYPLAAQGLFGKQEKIERIDESPHRKKWRNGEEVGPGVNKKFTRDQEMAETKMRRGRREGLACTRAGLPGVNFRGQGEGSCRTKVWDRHMRLVVTRDNPMKPRYGKKWRSVYMHWNFMTLQSKISVLSNLKQSEKWLKKSCQWWAVGYLLRETPYHTEIPCAIRHTVFWGPALLLRGTCNKNSKGAK